MSMSRSWTNTQSYTASITSLIRDITRLKDSSGWRWWLQRLTASSPLETAKWSDIVLIPQSSPSSEVRCSVQVQNPPRLQIKFIFDFSLSSLALNSICWLVHKCKQDYRLWNGTLPALTLCYHNRFDESKAQTLIRRFWNIGTEDEEFEYFLNFTRTVVNSSISTLEDFAGFAEDKRFDIIDMLHVASETHPTTNFVVSSYDLLFNPVPVQVMTEKGICYTTNSILQANEMATT